MLLNCRASIICAEFQVWLPSAAPTVVASSTQPLPAGGGVAVCRLANCCNLIKSHSLAQSHSAAAPQLAICDPSGSGE